MKYEDGRDQGCEMISGTADELRSLGFLRLPNGTSAIWCVDPRGLRTQIRRSCSGEYVAYCEIPGARFMHKPEGIAPGVSVVRYDWGDLYSGSQAALEAAGIANGWEFPGQPGMRKTRVTVFVDGTVYDGPRHANPRFVDKAISRVIVQDSPSMFKVFAKLSESGVEVRRVETAKLWADIKRHNEHLHRPARLRPEMCDAEPDVPATHEVVRAAQVILAEVAARSRRGAVSGRG